MRFAAAGCVLAASPVDRCMTCAATATAATGSMFSAAPADRGMPDASATAVSGTTASGTSTDTAGTLPH